MFRCITANFSYVTAAVLSLGLIALPVQAEAAAPGTTVRKVVDEVREAVKANEGKVSAEELDKKLRDIIAPVFDFRSMARSSLAQNWNKATPEQQKEFVDLFSDLLARNYLKKIRENVASSDFNLVDEKTKGKKAIVRTTVKYDEDQTADIDYRMRLKDDSWLVYDVIVENIGLVSNYRSEFAGIVKKEKVAGLINRLRSKEIGAEEK